MRNRLRKKLLIDKDQELISEKIKLLEDMQDHLELLTNSLKKSFVSDLKQAREVLTDSNKLLSKLEEGIKDVQAINKAFKSGSEISMTQDGGCWGLIFYPEGQGNTLARVKYYEFKNPMELSNVISHFQNKSIDAPSDMVRFIK